MALAIAIALCFHDALQWPKTALQAAIHSLTIPQWHHAVNAPLGRSLGHSGAYALADQLCFLGYIDGAVRAYIYKEIKDLPDQAKTLQCHGVATKIGPLQKNA